MLFNPIQSLKLSHLLDVLRRRGVSSSLIHALRKLGMILEVPLAGPSVLRITPMGAICNHACPMCWRLEISAVELERTQRKDRELGMRLDDYRALFDSMPVGLHEVTVIGGGEPLIHPDIVDILREVKRHGWRGVLVTNGSLLREAVARELIAMRWQMTRVSVNASDRESYRLANGVDHFATVCANLKGFTQLRREAGAEKNCELVLSCVIQSSNIASIARLFELGEEVGADALYFTKIVSPDGRLELTLDEMQEARARLLEGSRNSPLLFNREDILAQLTVAEACLGDGRAAWPARLCVVGFLEAFINSDGEVIPCCYSTEALGHLRQQSFRQIWYGAKYQAFRKRLIRGQFADYCIKLRCAAYTVLHDKL